MFCSLSHIAPHIKIWFFFPKFDKELHRIIDKSVRRKKILRYEIAIIGRESYGTKYRNTWKYIENVFVHL